MTDQDERRYYAICHVPEHGAISARLAADDLEAATLEWQSMNLQQTIDDGAIQVETYHQVDGFPEVLGCDSKGEPLDEDSFEDVLHDAGFQFELDCGGVHNGSTHTRAKQTPDWWCLWSVPCGAVS